MKTALQMGRFETEVLTQPGNLKALTKLSGHWNNDSNGKWRFTLKATRLALILLWILSTLHCVEASDTNSRPASLNEMQTLFDLATIGPQRQRLVADITTYEPKWSEEQIAAEVEQQNELFPNMRQAPESAQEERTNAIARSHSGIRILHVQEWYSGNLYRVDLTDEGIVSKEYLTNHPGTYERSYVDIDDPALSPYRSFTVDYQLRDIDLSKTVLFAKNNLWRALGLDQEVVLPLLVALEDPQSLPWGRRSTDADLDMLKLDPVKAEKLRDGSNPIWHLEAITESGQEDRTRFILRGRAPSPIKPYGLSDMEFVYVVGRVGHRPVCLEASLTNYTTHVSFFSMREDFDSQGFPRVWKRTTLIPGSPANQVNVVFKEVELNATFNDAHVFLPTYPTNYNVSDVTSGKGVLLQNPLHLPVRTQPRVQATLAKRMIILCLLMFITVVIGTAMFRYKSKKAFGIIPSA